MKPVAYTDGTISREVEEDWEATGTEEMNELYKKCKQPHSIISVRDQLNSIHSLVNVCGMALAGKDWKGQEYCQLRVCEVLVDYVAPEIKKAEEALGEV